MTTLVDDRVIDVAAPPEATKAALRAVLARVLGGGRARLLARLLGATRAEFEGFRVVEDAPSTLVLEGEHRFARYTLAFRMEALPEGTRLTATSRAQFPGLLGALYRWIVVGPFHGPVTRSILRAVARRAPHVPLTKPFRARGA